MPALDGPVQFVAYIEANAHIFYPALAVLILGSIAYTIVQAWRAHDLDGVQKAELKRNIVIELRKQPAGTSVDGLARLVGLDPFKCVRLLEEMQKDGLVLSHTNTSRLTVWQVKGSPKGRTDAPGRTARSG